MFSCCKPMENYAAISPSSHSRRLVVNFAPCSIGMCRLLSARLGVGLLSYVRTIKSASLHVLYHISASCDLAPKCRSTGRGRLMHSQLKMFT